ncbi:MAG: response regulator [Candidatus Riflebacteria bacterium]|nr:response regulator [Candidatus Riflebacteria bacterium]
MKVLIVEDENITRFCMVQNVKSFGHETFEASNGIDGLKLFNNIKPDIVFSDINMPDMDGLQMLKEIREIDSESIVIITSTMSAPEYTLSALRLKANDYLIKPVIKKDISEILRKYDHILANRSENLEVIAVSRKQLEFEIGNDINLVGKIANRLLIETENSIWHKEKLGIRLGLVEILTNAIEHGNLEISYLEKSQALDEGIDKFMKLIDSRKKETPYSSRKVLIEFILNKNFCEWYISDEGPGFDWKNIPNPIDPENLTNTHGRGIFLTKLQFDELEYLGKGNQIRLRKFFNPREKLF